MSTRQELRDFIKSNIQLEPVTEAEDKIYSVGLETAKEVFGDKYDEAKAKKMIRDIISKGKAEGMSDEDIAGRVQSSFRETNEGVLRGIGSAALTPLRLAGTAVKTAGKTVTAPIKVAGTAVGTAAKTAGNILTLKPGKAAKSLVKGVGKMAKHAVSPATTAIKGTAGAVRKVGTALAAGVDPERAEFRNFIRDYISLEEDNKELEEGYTVMQDITPADSFKKFGFYLDPAETRVIDGAKHYRVIYPGSVKGGWRNGYGEMSSEKKDCNLMPSSLSDKHMG
jgi:hypothetical protein